MRHSEAQNCREARAKIAIVSTLIEACAFSGGSAGLLSQSRSDPMCDYSLHAVASRPAKVGETLMTTMFRGTSTRGFASELEPAVAVCMLPGTELAFAEDVRYDSRWIWTKTIRTRVAKFNTVERHVPDRHHDAIEFADGSQVLVTQLREGQCVTVLQLPVSKQPAEPTKETKTIMAEITPTRPISMT
jgi:hypothetical protein